MAVSVAAALLLGAVFAGDSVWVALAALLVAGGWGALALAGRAPLPGGGGALLGLLLATAAWSGLSIVWSVAPDLSWLELNRTLVYVSFLAVGLLLAAGQREAGEARRGGADRRVRRRHRLGTRGQGDPGRLPRRRPRRQAARPDRILERARARGRRVAGARALVRRLGTSRLGAHGLRGACLRGRRRDLPGRLARGRRRGGARNGALALASPRPRRGGPARARRDRARNRRRGLGVHPAGARGGRRLACRPRRRRRLVRAAPGRRRRARRGRRPRAGAASAVSCAATPCGAAVAWVRVRRRVRHRRRPRGQRRPDR